MENMIFETAQKVRIREESQDLVLVYHDERGYETNAVGAEIVRLCKDSKSFTQICMALQESFEISLEEIIPDVREILGIFMDNGLLIGRMAEERCP